MVRREKLRADGRLAHPLAAQHHHPVDREPHLPGGGRGPAGPLAAGASGATGAAVLREVD